MAKKKIEETLEDIIVKPIEVHMAKVNNEKEELLALYQTLKNLGINSIGDLENKIARL